MWWQQGVVYQIYPRSFQDSDGDGIGDLRGIERRLDHIVRLGADAIWLSPIYPSPQADGGYDVSDFLAVDPAYGTMEDLDRLLAAAHERGLRLLMDLVPCHTSIEHPWFREHPDWYIWRDGDRPPNNWAAAFGGSAWTRDARTGRWYLHSFYPEQPDLDWRNPEVVRAMQDVMRFWLDRGVDGFRLDALDRLMKDAQLRDEPPATGPPALPMHRDDARLEHIHSRNDPDVSFALAALREAAGERLLVGEVYLPTRELPRYLDQVDLAFCFELVHAPWQAEAVRRTVAAALPPAIRAGGIGWVLSNHDFRRLASRVGRANVRGAALLNLTLPGTAFVYQGDEIGMEDGPGADPPADRARRDRYRHPMAWDGGPHGGFTDGQPWLPAVDPPSGSVADQESDPGSLLAFHRRAIALRRGLGPDLRFVDGAPDVLAYERGRHLVALNLAAEPRPAPAAGDLALATWGGGGEPAPRELAGGAGFVAERH